MDPDGPSPDVSWELRARRSEAHLAALDSAVRGISGVLALDLVLQLIVDRVRDLAAASYAALGIVSADGAIERFITSGLTDAERGRIGALPRGLGLLGLIIREGQTFRIPDIAQDPRRHGFPPHHPEMHSFLGVPIIVEGKPVGDLYLTNKQGAAQFSADDQALVETFALHAGIAIENARLHGQVQRLAVIDERDRISRDLHDSVIQSIYAVTLALDDVPELVGEAPAEARQRVDDAIDALHGVIRDLRNFIFGLRPLLLDSGSLLDGLRALAEELRRNTATEIEIHGEEPDRLTIDVVAELLAIAREALANIARHSGAERAWIRLGLGDESLRLEIGDDGRGLAAGVGPTRGHHGLANMRARAQGVGGDMEIHSGEGAGTRIIVTIPRTGAEAEASR